MSRAKFQMMKLCMLLPLVAITACSKTVQWEEEVPLNTGETIWVKRSDTYVRCKWGGGQKPDRIVFHGTDNLSFISWIQKYRAARF
jgi:hypothetical protein